MPVLLLVPVLLLLVAVTLGSRRWRGAATVDAPRDGSDPRAEDKAVEVEGARGRAGLSVCPHRQAFLEKAQSVLAARAGRKEPVSLVRIDLGPDVPEGSLLERVVSLWKPLLPAGALLCAFDPGAFALLLPGVRVEVAVSLAERLCSRLQDEAPVRGSWGPVTTHFGVTAAASGMGAFLLLQNADRALYEAKERSRNRLVVGCLMDDEGALQACLEPDEE